MAAKTNAQRQADYRKSRATAGENGDGECRINAFVSTGTSFALTRLARHHGVTKRELLEKMILGADRKITNSLELDSEEWAKYFGVTQ